MKEIEGASADSRMPQHYHASKPPFSSNVDNDDDPLNDRNHHQPQ
jgi:hypothetical protein